MAKRILLLLVFFMPFCAGCGAFEKFIEDLRSGEIWGSAHGVLLYASDALVYPQQETTLNGFLKSPKTMSGIAGVTLTFYQGDRVAGSAVTDKHGLAQIQYKAAGEGHYDLTVRPTALPANIEEDYSGAMKVSATLLVEVRRWDTKFIVLDLDRTVVNESYANIIGKEDWPIMPYSLEVLRKLSARYGVIYLTQRPYALTPKTKQWLRRNQFPPGPLITGDFRQTIKNPREVKGPKIAALKAIYPNVQIGVGDQVGDAYAYLDNGLTAYIIPHYDVEEKKYTLSPRQILNLPKPDKIQVVADWLEIEEGILGGKRFSPEEFVKKR